MSQPQFDNDPLLEFSIEPGAPPVAVPAAQHVEPIASPAVSAGPPIDQSAHEVEQLRARLDSLEKTLNESRKDVAALRSEVATLVAAAADIKRRSGRAAAPSSTSTAGHSLRRPTRLASAIGGVMLGAVLGMWFWMSTGNEPVAPVAPIAIANEPLPAPPAPALVAPVTQPAIVPAASITPVSAAPARVTPMRMTPARVNYVGALSIDADPAGDVFIDRIAAGKTPMRADNLKAGSHLVWIERDGYRRFTRVVLVPADRVTRLVADLEPAQR